MNQSFDYVALVEQHLADEKLARRLQQQEVSKAYFKRGLFSRVKQFPSEMKSSIDLWK